MQSVTPEMQTVLKMFGQDLRSKAKQAATIESYSRDAKEFLLYIGQFKLSFDRVEPETLLSFRDHLIEHGNDRENSVRRKIIGIRQFFRFLAAERMISQSPFDDMPLPERDENYTKPPKSGQIETILSKLTGGGLKVIRDRAILHLLAFEGVKAHEMIELQWTDFIGGQAATLNLPGTKSRLIQLQEKSRFAVEAYNKAFIHWAESLTPEKSSRFKWIFVSFKGKNGSLVLPKMTRHGLKFMLCEIGERFHLTHFNTEALRHYAIEHLMTNGLNADQIMEHLGLRRPGNVAKHFAKRKSRRKDA